MQGPKTRAHQRQIRQDNLTSGGRRRRQGQLEQGENGASLQEWSSIHEGEIAMSRKAINQESDHNKHNEAGQSGHKAQQHTVAEEKQK